MSLISTTASGKQWARYFVLDTKPFLGEVYDDTATYIKAKNVKKVKMERLMNAFPGKVPSYEEIDVPEAVMEYLEYVRSDPNAKPSKEALAEMKGCPINLPKLAQYLTMHVDFDGDSVSESYTVELYKAYYTVPPTLMELAALKTNEIGLTTEEVTAIIGGKNVSKRVKQLTHVTVGRAVPQQATS